VAGHSGERRHGKVGQRVREVPGDDGNPFWGGREEKVHHEMCSMVRRLGGGDLRVAGRR
jgi:hypothetical protein